MSEYELIDNTENNQYEIQIGRFTPRIEYIKTDDEIYLTHTEVPMELEGRGVGSGFLEQVLIDIDKQGLRLVPMCPFVAGYLKKHPEWKRLVVK
ncbi:GNAT family N-acetyltransferase [Apibacter raozihei]|uniref:GNAT family N-acetyltransferase n=1 Tax=Apibacter TaxID=1778601 RepID=UPI000FE2F2DA|nr:MULTISPECIES: GNAT family N-acetyltransferase [Apibacter]